MCQLCVKRCQVSLENCSVAFAIDTVTELILSQFKICLRCHSNARTSTVLGEILKFFLLIVASHIALLVQLDFILD